MMLLSRFWYVIITLVMGVAVYVVYVAVGQYNRRNTVILNEGLNSDSQTLEWALKIDARRRLDALLHGSVDKGMQESLLGANGKEKVPTKSRDDAKRALLAINEKMSAEHRADALFAVDRDGRVVAQNGFDSVAQNEDFELGGYPAVYDALHGVLRDDAWVLGEKLYIVCARPVEYDASQPPIGAVVALKEISRNYATELAKRTRTNLAFFAGGKRVASAPAAEGFDDSQFDQIALDLPKMEDKYFEVDGRSEMRMLRDDLGIMYARLPGDAWSLKAGFAVARNKVTLDGPLGFLDKADDKDKKRVPFALLAVVVVVFSLVGIGLTFLEHSLPLSELMRQAERLRAGQQDAMQLARLRGPYRVAGQNINLGMERIVEKGGGVARRPADLESILGPVPAQPAMSAFAFPMDGPGGQPASGPKVPPGPSSSRGTGSAPKAVPGLASPVGGQASFPPAAGSGPAASSAQGSIPSPGMARPVAPGNAPPLPTRNQVAKPPAPGSGARSYELPTDEQDDDEATMVAAIPPDVLVKATGEQRVVDDTTEWQLVYDDFLRTKQQCGEATDGLTFEKFQNTLRKNRDALIQRHGCKRVRFSVYVKDGRASLKATPVKE